MEYLIGQGIVAVAGHDTGKCYVIYRVEPEYVYLVDGSARTRNNPKKKNKKHIKPIEGAENLLPWMNDNNILTRNEDIKRAIKTYSRIMKGELPL